MSFLPFPTMLPGSVTTGGGGGGGVTTWNPLDKHANITLSGGNLIATGAGAAQLVRADRSLPLTDKAYWETTQTGDTLSNLVSASGLVTNAVSTSTQMGGPGANLGFYIHGAVLYYNNAVVFDFANSSASPQVIMWAYDPATRKVWVGRAGTWFNSGDPAAGTGQVYTLPAGTYYPGATPNGYQVTANFGASAFGATVPSGYVAYNSAS